MSVEGNMQTEYASLSGKIHTLVIDKTLSISGAAADAKAVGAAMEELEGKVDDGVEAAEAAIEAAEEAYKNAEAAFEQAKADVEKTVEEELEEFAEGMSKFGQAAFIKTIPTRTKINAYADVPVGGVLTFNVGGASKEFIVVHHGKPGDIYADNCDGTWLLMKELLYMDGQIGEDYATSSHHAYLNGAFLTSLEADLRASIKAVNIPYVTGIGASGVLHTGADGLSARVFTPSFAELHNSIASDIFADGALLDYFNSTYMQTRRVLKDSDGTARSYVSRTPKKVNSKYWAGFYTSGGTFEFAATTASYYYPAMFVVDSSADISSKGLYTDGTTIYEDSGDLHDLVNAAGAELNLYKYSRAEIVSYVGPGGTVGQNFSNPGSITFSFAPKFVWWFDNKGAPWQDQTSTPKLWRFSPVPLPEWGKGSTNNSPISNMVFGKEDEGRTIKWYYSPGGDNLQYYTPIASGLTFYVLAIG